MTRPAKHATLAEVAKKAGVGTTTVSRVINGGQNVDPKTLARVQRAIVSLGYQPNQAARILKGASTRTIGLVIPSIADPFFASCAESAQAVVRSHGSVLTVLTTQNDPKAELDALHVLLRHRVDGLIIAPCNAEDDVLTEVLGRLAMPVVSLDRPIAGSRIPAVLSDNYGGARMATEHLLEHGYKRIVCLTRDTQLFTIQERIRGYREGMQAAGLKPDVEITATDRPSLEGSMRRLFTRAPGPQAIFTLKNSLTVDIFEIAQRTGLSIPDRLALLGYDDFQLADIVRPSISVIAQPIEDIGRVAAELLCDRLLGKPSTAGVTKSSAGGDQVLLPTQLIRRASCGCKLPA